MLWKYQVVNKSNLLLPPRYSLHDELCNSPVQCRLSFRVIACTTMSLKDHNAISITGYVLLPFFVLVAPAYLRRIAKSVKENLGGVDDLNYEVSLEKIKR